MRKQVSIVDYGLGNLFSITRAFEHCGAEVTLVDDANNLLQAEHLVLPGVGAFARGMQELTKRDLVEATKEFAESGQPLLGICLGMQMLFESAEEFGFQQGLGLIPGEVVAIPKNSPGGQRKIPHIGWSHLNNSNDLNWEGTLLHDVSSESAVYFLHSYMACPTLADNVLATCDYQGLPVCAVVRDKNIYGCQFHPEKSGSVGLAMIATFLQL